MKSSLRLFVLFAGLFLSTSIVQAQKQLAQIPHDLDKQKIIFLKYQAVEVEEEKPKGAQAKYLWLRKKSHNQAIHTANEKLLVAALEYPYAYALSTQTAYQPLMKAGYRYVLDSNVFNNEHLLSQPEEDVLIEFDFFIRDMVTDKTFYLFSLDEMKTYDYKLIMRKFMKEVKKAFPQHGSTKN